MADKTAEWRAKRITVSFEATSAYSNLPYNLLNT